MSLAQTFDPCICKGLRNSLTRQKLGSISSSNDEGHKGDEANEGREFCAASPCSSHNAPNPWNDYITPLPFSAAMHCVTENLGLAALAQATQPQPIAHRNDASMVGLGGERSRDDDKESANASKTHVVAGENDGKREREDSKWKAELQIGGKGEQQLYSDSNSSMTEGSRGNRPTIVVERHPRSAPDGLPTWQSGLEYAQSWNNANQASGIGTEAGASHYADWCSHKQRWSEQAIENTQGRGNQGGSGECSWGSLVDAQEVQAGRHNTSQPSLQGVPNRATGAGDLGSEDDCSEPQFSRRSEFETGAIRTGRVIQGGINAATWGWNHKTRRHANSWKHNVQDGRAFDANPEQCPGHVRSRHPSLAQNTESGPFCASPSRHLSEAIVRPHSRPQPQHHPMPNITTGVHTYHSQQTDATKHQLPQPSSQIEANPLIQELRNQNTNQAELLTEQRLRIAVLENDLEYMKSAKENAVNAAIFLAQNWGSTTATQSNSTHKVTAKSQTPGQRAEAKYFVREVEQMKKEVALSQENREDLFLGILSSSEENEKHVSSSSIKGEGKGKERISQPSKTQASDVARRIRTARGASVVSEKDESQNRVQEAAAELLDRVPGANEKSLSNSESDIKAVSGWHESFSSDVTTIPNSPNLNASSLSSSSALEQHAYTSQRANRMSDVGLQSLDDCLENELEILQPAPVSSKKLESLSTQIETNMKSLLHFANVPSPSLLKTGFDIHNAKQGAEYDLLIPQNEFHSSRASILNLFNTNASANPHSKPTSFEMRSSPEQEGGASRFLETQGRQDSVRHPDMFKNRVQYVPEKDDKNYFRTVCISNLPAHIKLRDVLSRVRGGLITNAILMDTRSLLKGRMSAMVFFLEDRDAAAYVEYVSTHPITFGPENDALKATVTLVLTPTYPLSQQMVWRIQQEKPHTRCLTIQDFPAELSLSRLQYDIACHCGHKADNLIEIYLDGHNSLHLEFPNIAHAGSSFVVLTNFSSYRGLEVSFAPDPCAGPIEELSLPVPPRPPLRPRNRLSSPLSQESFSKSLSTRHGPGGSTSVSGGVVITPRERLTKTTTQQTNVPSFSGSTIKSSSWADEMIEESGSNNAMVPISADAVCLSAITSNSRDCSVNCNNAGELPHPWSEAPPRSPINSILPTYLQPGREVEDVANAPLSENGNVLKKEAVTAFRKAPVVLSNYKISTITPSLEEMETDVHRDHMELESIARKTTHGLGNTLGLDERRSTCLKTPPTSKERSEKSLENASRKQSLSDTRLGNVLLAALDFNTNEPLKGAQPKQLEIPPNATAADEHSPIPKQASQNPPSRPSSILPRSLCEDTSRTVKRLDPPSSPESGPLTTYHLPPNPFSPTSKAKQNSCVFSYALLVPKPDINTLAQDWTASMNPSFPAGQVGILAPFNLSKDAREQAHIESMKAQGYRPCVSFGQKAWVKQHYFNEDDIELDENEGEDEIAEEEIVQGEKVVESLCRRKRGISQKREGSDKL